MRRVTSREYKLMLRVEAFADVQSGLDAVRENLKSCASAAGCRLTGAFDESREREIVFLDTAAHDLDSHKLLLRERRGPRRVEYTLKCRSPDRYLAAGAATRELAGLTAETKFEEDIATPFRSRFSRSTTIDGKLGRALGRPETIGEASRLFPGIKTVGATQEFWRRKPLVPVSGIQSCETVLTGPTLDLPGADATVALIVWRLPSSTPIQIAELSFRYAGEKEQFPARTARSALSIFEFLQQSPMFDTNGSTKTQFVFDRAEPSDGSPEQSTPVPARRSISGARR